MPAGVTGRLERLRSSSQTLPAVPSVTSKRRLRTGRCMSCDSATTAMVAVWPTSAAQRRRTSQRSLIRSSATRCGIWVVSAISSLFLDFYQTPRIHARVGGFLPIPNAGPWIAGGKRAWLHPMDEQPSILIVDDDEVLRDRLARALRDRGWEVRTAGDYVSAMASARAESPQYALVDLKMPGRSGLELVRD